MNTLAIADLFAADGELASAIPGFTERVEQIAMAQTVSQALTSRGRYVIEAGTGIGKTFAYLVPILFAGKRVIVSTGTRTLQDQLFHRDLPMITAALGRPIKISILKGRANYLCLHRLDLAERDSAMNSRRSGPMRTLNRIRRWSLTTHSGDIAELSDIGETDPLWQSVTSTRENCLGADCSLFQRCHVVAARREAQAADVVVVNHYLLMADLLLKEQGFGDLLPGADAIVIDEAHQLPEVAEQFLGFALSTRQLLHLCRDVSVEMQTQRLMSEDITRALAQLEQTVATGVDSLQAERCESSRWPREFTETLVDIGAHLKNLTQQLESLSDVQPALESVSARADELETRINVLLNEREDEGQSAGVRWAEANRQGFSVHYAPIDVAKQLAALIDAHSAAWIFTSATLSVAGDFAHYLRRIGIDDVHTHSYGSPFNFQEQALLYLPRGLDTPASAGYTQQVIDAALPVLEASGGRAFLLFTSHRALRAAATYLRERWGDSAPYPLLVQGDAPRDRLLQLFREAGNAVLLATGSFWEGVDVKGAALAVVVIDKLPFAVPDDPVMKARLAAIEARGGKPFFEEQIPSAVVALKQGVGRLIRDVSDFGVVMLCDQRLTTRAYGRIFLDSLPSMPRTQSLTKVQEFLRNKLTDAGLSTTAPTSSLSESLVSREFFAT